MRGKLNHIEIYVNNLDESKKFWGWLLNLLGYKEFQTWDMGVSYILDNTYLVFVQTEEKFLDIPYHRRRTGLNHLAFYGGSVDFVDNLTNKLKEKNVKILYEDKHPFAGGKNHYAVYFEDPNRIKVEVTAD